MSKQIGSVVTVEDFVSDFLRGDPAYLFAGGVSKDQELKLRVTRLEELARLLAREIDKSRDRYKAGSNG